MHKKVFNKLLPKTKPHSTRQEYAEFTEAEYVRLLDLAASKYHFCDYGEESNEPFVVWRHDIDYSPQRALALANIEADRNLHCVYHVLISGRYYSVFEPEVINVLKKIVKLGHGVGLHIDMDVFHVDDAVPEKILLERIAFEKNILGQILETPIRSMSFHNYKMNEARLEEANEICGMVNICAPSFYRTFNKYVSDSNGIWQRNRLEDVLTASPVPRLHVLTHPVWWTAEPMSPIQRFRRAVMGRAEDNLEFYFTLMKRDGRYHEIASRIGLPGDDSDLV